MMFMEGTNAVRIEPQTQGFEDYDIILSNIIVDVSFDIGDEGVFVDANQVLRCIEVT